jgi:hypothetical protein
VVGLCWVLVWRKLFFASCSERLVDCEFSNLLLLVPYTSLTMPVCAVAGSFIGTWLLVFALFMLPVRVCADFSPTGTKIEVQEVTLADLSFAVDLVQTAMIHVTGVSMILLVFL